jgi:predicted N-formylglutamate amidohydrolase
VTCEHAGNDLPEGYKKLFVGHLDVLKTHEGWDPGAIDVAGAISAQLHVPLFKCSSSRLLVEVNRSPGHPSLFSRFTRILPGPEKEKLIREIYNPYRDGVESAIDSYPKPVIHLSVHTFTPVWNGAKRNVDIGLLFDPARKLELAFCESMANGLVRELSKLEIKFNEPYKGVDDGFTTYLRTKFSDDEYAGVEIEINQKYIADLSPIARSLIGCLRKLV